MWWMTRGKGKCGTIDDCVCPSTEKELEESFHMLRQEYNQMYKLDEDDEEGKKPAIPLGQEGSKEIVKSLVKDGHTKCQFYLRFKRIDLYDKESPFELVDYNFLHTHPLDKNLWSI